MQPKAEELKFVTKSDGYVHIHPSSVNYQVGILFLSAKHALFYNINHLCLIIYDYSKGSLLMFKKKVFMIEQSR